MKRLRWILFIAFSFFIVWFTILSRTPSFRRADLRFMWSYIELLTGNPNWKKDVTQNLQNILFFVPFGVLLPVKRWWTMFIIAALFSTWIEFIQYIGGFGLAELDDVICNTLGAIIGFKVWTWLKGKIDATGEKARNL